MGKAHLVTMLTSLRTGRRKPEGTMFQESTHNLVLPKKRGSVQATDLNFGTGITDLVQEVSGTLAKGYTCSCTVAAVSSTTQI